MYIWTYLDTLWAGDKIQAHETQRPQLDNHFPVRFDSRRTATAQRTLWSTMRASSTRSSKTRECKPHQNEFCTSKKFGFAQLLNNFVKQYVCVRNYPTTRMQWHLKSRYERTSKAEEQPVDTVFLQSNVLFLNIFSALLDWVGVGRRPNITAKFPQTSSRGPFCELMENPPPPPRTCGLVFLVPRPW